MKKHITFFMLLALSQIAMAQSEYRVTLCLEHLQGFPVHISYTLNKQIFVDSAVADAKGTVTFKGSVKEPVVGYLSVQNPSLGFLRAPTYKQMVNAPRLEFTLSNAQIKVTGNADSLVLAHVTGGLNNEWGSLKPKFSQFAQELFFASKLTAQTFAKTKEIKVLLQPGNVVVRNIQISDSLKKEYIKSHPSNFLSIYFLAEIFSRYDEKGLKETYEELGAKYKSTSYSRLITEIIQINEQMKIGNMAPDFVKTDILGKRLSLNDLKGKYVLLDFWGSWCGPCRESFPNLIAQYNKYRNQGFEIIGIAREMSNDLKRAQETWKSGVELNHLPWLQVLNNAPQHEIDIVKQYAVSAFPTQILIDKEGKIIEKYVGENLSLNTQLEQLFKE